MGKVSIHLDVIYMQAILMDPFYKIMENSTVIILKFQESIKIDFLCSQWLARARGSDLQTCKALLYSLNCPNIPINRQW